MSLNPTEHADGCQSSCPEDSRSLTSPKKCKDASWSEDPVQPLKSDIYSDFFQKESQNQTKGPFRKFLRTLIYLAIVVAGASSLLIVVSYGAITSWDFLKKFYSTPLEDSTRTGGRESEGSEHVPVQDVMYLLSAARANGARVLGPNTAGLVTPGARPSEATDQSPHNDTPRVYITSVSSANIRSRPDANARIVMITHHGEELIVSGESGNWLMLRLEDDSIGWIHRSLAEEKQETFHVE